MENIVTESGQTRIEQIIRKAAKPADKRPPWQWIEENLNIQNSPYGRHPNFSITPWLKEPLEVFADNQTRMITTQACVQGAKSFAMQTAGIWALCENPGPLLYYVQTGDHANSFAETRWLPMVESCEPLKGFFRENRHAKRTTKINFKHTFSYILAANTSNAQSISARYVLCDEPFIWANGLLLECHKRTTQWWNRKIWNSSTPGDANTDFDKCFETGDKREWMLACPKCRRRQIPNFKKNIVWQENEKTRPAGQWNYAEVRKTVKFKCSHCRKEYAQTEAISRFMNLHGKYRKTNPTAPAGQVSFRWNALALAPSVFSWADLVQEFLEAKTAYNNGYLPPLKEFFTKRMAEAWQPNEQIDYTPLATVELSAGFVGKDAPQELTPAQLTSWPKADHIFMAADVQSDHFWYVTEAWSNAGDSMTLEAGKVFSWDELAEIQKKYRVPDQNVAIDMAHRTREVQIECVRHGHFEKTPRGKAWLCWKALRGEDKDHFLYVVKRGNKKGRKFLLPYSWPPTFFQATIGMRNDDPRKKELRGRMAAVLRWSNPTIKDVAISRRDGRVKGVENLIAKGHWNKEFSRQMHSERKIAVPNSLGQTTWRWQAFRDNHLFDCRCMILVLAFMRQLIGEKFDESAP